MATCQGTFCTETEYLAKNVNATSKYSGPKTKEDGCLKNRAEAEKQAKQHVEDAVKNQNEKTDCGGNCKCRDVNKFSKWEELDSGNEWKEDITVNGCQFTVTVTYDRDYREKINRCYSKPPKSPK